MKKADILQRLKWQRGELDGLIHEIGGRRHADIIVSPETANDMVTQAFSDIERSLKAGRIDEANCYARQYQKIKWFEG